jgi:hypothetical protein
MPAAPLRRFLLPLLILLLAVLVVRGESGDAAPPPAPTGLQVYLLIGQSNMAGRAPFTEAQARPIPHCYLLNGTDQWEPATNPLNRYSTVRKGLGMQKLNPGYGFALALLKHDPKRPLGLVVNAKGGSSIEQWAADTKFYKEAVRRAAAAQQTGTLAGICWHQGESNTENRKQNEPQRHRGTEKMDCSRHPLPFLCASVSLWLAFL